MVDAIVSSLLEQLTSFVAQEIQEEARLVVGVEKEVEKLTNNLQDIEAVLVDAERRQVKEKRVRLWLDRLKHASYNMEDVLDEWNTARLKLQMERVPLKEVCSFLPTTCFGFKQVVLRHDIAHKIKEINENLNEIARAKNDFAFNTNVIKSIDENSERVDSISFIDESEICGRREEKNTLISKLLCESSSEQICPHIISLVGMGGIGKTTLAQLAYNDVEVKNNFNKTIWVCVSDPFDEFRIARAIIEGLEGSASNLGVLQSLMNLIRNSVVGKKFLLVLDDVWNEDYTNWEPFYRCLKNGLHGSKILITTRKETVARAMRSTDIISINILTEEECWSLFKRSAFFDKSIEECEKFEQIGRKIVKKCKGLPLAAKTIGSLLNTKNTEEEWRYILNSEMWEQEELEKGLFAPLLLSYNDLPPVVKRCFSYCAIFPKDYLIRKDQLINLWMAQGYLGVQKNKDFEIIGEKYFRILATRSFFQEFKKDNDDDDDIVSCKMHDIVHDFAQFLSKGECLAMEIHNGHEESLKSLPMEVCHSMLMLGQRVPVPDSIGRLKRLRSLLIYGKSGNHSLTNKVLEELFCKLTCLRVLDLGVHLGFWSVSVGEIPRNINKLVHLRYVNLSRLDMEKLPEALCELYNLQILDVSNCVNLKELPQGIGRLINMMYLLNDNTASLRFLPLGIERLTNLQRLTKFVHSSQGCTFESLKNLKLLWECKIYVGVERKRLELDKMEKLLVLGLRFDSEEGRGRKNEENKQFLEALQPPINLKELNIDFLSGNFIFPNLMMSLTNVRILRLFDFKNCEYLAHLGKLPTLEILVLHMIRSLKKFGPEFLGIESHNDSSSSSSSSSSTIYFPKLKSLTIEHMYELEEWDCGIERNEEIMPRLSILKISYCYQLKALPERLLQTTTLQTLEIRRCPILTERYGRRTGADWQKISHIPKTFLLEEDV